MFRTLAVLSLCVVWISGCTVHRDGTSKKGPGGDRDKDGIINSADLCPAEMETANGYKDADGCPDEIPPKPAIRSLHYGVNSSNVASESKAALEDVAQVLKKYPALTIRVEGHTDSYGTKAYNLQISKQRADSVRKWLVEKHGVAAARIEAEGYGMSKPVGSFNTKEGRIANRRIDFVITGGWPPKE